jgi:hypothetical protein
MIIDISLSLAIGAVFILFGFPFALLLTDEGENGEELRVVTLSCVLGMAISVIVCSNVISFGGSLAVALAWCFIVWLGVMLIKRPVILVRRYLRSAGFALMFVAGQSILIGFTKPFDALFGMRIGVDAALYADGAQVMLESTGQSGLAAMSAVSPTSFGPAGLLNHLRWGTPMLMAMATKLFGLDHSYQIIMPLMAVMIASTALLVVVLCKQLRLPNRLSLLTGVMVVFNYPLLHLAIEGQWPQVMSLPLVIAIFVLWDKSIKRNMPFVMSNSILIAASVLFYGEYLPILLGILIGTTIIEIGTKGIVHAFRSVLVVISSVLLAGAIIYPYTEKYLSHLFGLSLSVGYPTPHQANASEILGIGSIWSRWEDWNTIENTPIALVRENVVMDMCLSLVALCVLRWGIYQLCKHHKNWEHWFVVMCVACVLWFRFSYSLDKGYLWSKSVATLSPLLIIVVIYGVWQTSKLQHHLQWLRVLIIGTVLSAVVITGIRGITDFRESEIPISRDTLEVSSFLRKGKGCVVLLKELGTTKDGANMFIRDLTFRYSMTAVFRHNPVLNGRGFIDFQGDPESISKRVCVVLDSDGSDLDLARIATKHAILFQNKHWIVIDGGISLDKLLEGNEHEYFKWIRVEG